MAAKTEPRKTPTQRKSPTKAVVKRGGKAAKNAKRKQEMAAQKKADQQRASTSHLLRQLRKATLSKAIMAELPRAKPEDVLEMALKIFVARAEIATAMAAGVSEKDYFVSTIAGKVPNHLIRHENEMWQLAFSASLRMANLDLDSRTTAAREQAAESFAAALNAVAERLNLTEQQRAALPEAIRQGLPAVLEGQATEK